MMEIGNRETSMLLAELDNEINIKCEEFKEKNKQLKQKRLFLFSCVFIFLGFIMQIFFRIFNVNFVSAIILYQVLAVVVITPFIPNMRKGVY